MKAPCAFVLALSLGCIPITSAHAQWLDTIVQFSDSTGYLRAPSQLLENPLTGRVYVLSQDGAQGGVLRFDPTTGGKLPLIRGVFDRAIYCPGVEKVYLGGRYWEDVLVVDAHADTILGSFSPESTGYLSSMAYSRTSRRLYLCYEFSDSLDVLVVDADADSVLSGFSFNDDPTGIYWEELNNRLYVAGTNDTSDLLVFDCSADTLVGCVAGGEDNVYSFAAKPSARKLYCGQGENGHQILVVDVDSMRLLRSVEANEPTQLLAYNPVYDRLYSGAYDEATLTIVDASTDSIRSELELETVTTSMTCSPTDGRVYLGTYDDLWVTVVDSTDTVAAVIPTSRGTPDMVLFSALRNELYSALNDDYAAIIDGAGDTVKAYIDYVFYQIRNPIHNPAGNKLYLLMNDEDIVRVMGPDNRVVKDIPVGLVDTRPHPVLNPILNRLYIADRDVFWVIDCNTDSLLRSVPMGTVDDPVALLHQDLNRVFVFPRRDASAVFVYDCLRDSFVATVEVGNNTPCAAYQPTVNRFYCGVYSTASTSIAVIDPVSCAVTAQLSAGRQSRGMRMLANPVNGLVYVANDRDNRLYIFDARADTLLRVETLAVDADTMFWNRTFNKAYLCHLNSTLVLDCNTNTFTGSIAAGVNRAGLMNDRNDKLYLGSLPGVNVVDCRTDSVIASLGGVTVPYNFAWSVVDNRVFTSARGNELAVYRDDLVAVESGDIPAHVSLQLGANPVRGRALLRARVPPGHTAELSVVDVSGRVILRQALSVERQASSVVLDLRSMPPGVYFARLEAGTQRSTGKFVLQR